MRTSLMVGGLWLAGLGLWMSGCGGSGSQPDSPGGGANTGAGMSSSGGNGAGHASGGDSASSGKAGAASAGTSTADGGAMTDGGATGEGGTTQPGAGGAESSGGAPGDLVDCDTRKVLCKIAIPECPANEVISVIGTCYGPCVKIDHCACSNADECPNNNEYTCWAKTHCGPYVRSPRFSALRRCPSRS